MNRSQGYLQYFALFTILALCLIGQVSSRKCYYCHSDGLPDCISGNLTTANVVDCDKAGGKKSTLLPGINDSFDEAGKTPVQYECGYAKGVAFKDGRTIVNRGCVAKHWSCDSVKIVNAAQGSEYAVQIETCKRCDSDECNSSGHLTAGFWTLSLSLLIACLFKL